LLRADLAFRTNTGNDVEKLKALKASFVRVEALHRQALARRLRSDHEGKPNTETYHYDVQRELNVIAAYLVGKVEIEVPILEYALEDIN